MRNSFIVWRGPSAWDGSPIRVQLVLSSTNGKTGDMAQAYILRDDMSPMDAYAERHDAAICGDCPLSGLQPNGERAGRACYVNVGRGPLATWKSNPTSVSLLEAAELLQGRFLRIGAYGEPAMVPLHVWVTLASTSRGWTGYTHQWSMLTPPWREYLMASVDSEEQAREARAFGWRTFRASATGDPMPGEVVCPNTLTGRQCRDCRACDGTHEGTKDGRVSIAIAAHGAGKAHIPA